MTNLYVVWEFTKMNGNEGVRRTVVDVEELNKSHFDHPGEMDWYDWLNMGLFFDQVLSGREDCSDMIHISIYGFYKNDEESKKVYDDLRDETIAEKINTKLHNKEVN